MPEEAGTSSGVSRGLVPGGLRRPGTQSVCLRQDRGTNRPEKWLNRFRTVGDCVWPPGASSGFLRAT